MAEQWMCPVCGAMTEGDVCEFCGAPRPKEEDKANAEEAVAEVTENEEVADATATQEEVEAGLEEEFDLGAEFAVDEAEVQDEATFSEDLSGYAAGFPDWDLVPPER